MNEDLVDKHLNEEDWKYDKMLPREWKSRESNAEKYGLFLSPEGNVFRCRKSVFQYMNQKGYPRGDIDRMQNLLSLENWMDHPLLPSDWKIRPVKSKHFRDKSYSPVLSKSGKEFVSYKAVLDFLKSSPEYGQTDLTNFEKLIEENQSARRKKLCEVWTDNETIPSGWKVRKSDEQTRKLIVMAPNGSQFQGR